MINITEKNITLSNEVGCSLKFAYAENKYGLGTFYLNDKEIGDTCNNFLSEDNNWVWDQYRAESYEIIRNDNITSIIKFTGTVGYGTYHAKFRIIVELPAKSFAYILDYMVDPYPNLSAPVHPLYVALPFDSSKMEFVQCPYETPVKGPYEGVWYFRPHLSKAPFMFGKEIIDNKQVYVGMGYRKVNHINYRDEYQYTSGKLLYESRDHGTAYRIYFPYEWLGPSLPQQVPPQPEEPTRTPNEQMMPFRLSMVYSTAHTQSDCIQSYIRNSAFEVNAELRSSLKDTVKEGWRGYREPGKLYIKGKGYRMRGWANTDDLGSYYKDMGVCVNITVAKILYDHWLENMDEAWAYERANEIIAFFINSQLPTGEVPDFWCEENNCYRVLNCEMTEKGFLYNISTMANAAIVLHKMYLAAKEHEGIEHTNWAEACQKIVDYISNRIDENGQLGRLYNVKGEFDEVCTESWPLIALDYYYTLTGNKKYEAARVRLEKWMWNNFVNYNDFKNTVFDDTSWKPDGLQLDNHDMLDVGNIVEYCVIRYQKTQSIEYLQKAKDVISYLWLNHVPVQIKGYRNVTKGLVQEQKIWSMYDTPWLLNTFRYLPYLSMKTGDPFYMGFYQVLTQAMAFYQYKDEKYPFFCIGLDPMPFKEGPNDSWGEVFGNGRVKRAYERPVSNDVWFDINFPDGKIGIAVCPYGSYFLADLNSKDTYYYVGGENWGIGLDYKLNFDVEFRGKPYVLASSTALISAWWEESSLSLKAIVNENAKKSGLLKVRMNGKKIKSIKLNGENIESNTYRYNTDTDSIDIPYVHCKPAMIFCINTK